MYVRVRPALNDHNGERARAPKRRERRRAPPPAPWRGAVGHDAAPSIGRYTEGCKKERNKTDNPFTDGVGNGIPLMNVVTADDGITTGVSSSSSSTSPAASRSSLRSVWLTLHAVNIRLIHPIFFSRSSARALNLSLLRTHVPMAIEAAFPTTCSSLVTSPASSFLFLSGMESVSAGRVQAITGAILSYSSSASAPNLDPIAFKEAALARLRNVAVSFESGAVRSTRAVALAAWACL